MTIAYTIVLISIALYSYVLVDPNLTLFNHPLWTEFRNRAVIIGYYNRQLSFTMYFILMSLLFIFHYYFVLKIKNIRAIYLAFIIGGVLFFSYPFLSHDFFNYLFDAKIVTVYHQNPWTHKALDFPLDPWLRFMHWTHRTYPYGPVWLLVSIVPSFLALGKLLLNLIFFKVVFTVFYIATVFYLNKLDKTYALFFATHPLILIEGLINSHNDFIALTLGLIGVFYLLAKHTELPLKLRSLLKNNTLQTIFARIHFLASTGIKYMTVGSIFLQKNKKSPWNKVAFVITIGAIGYTAYTMEIQPWYFLNIFIFIPYFFKFIYHLQIFFFGLLLSYYPYIFLGGWDTAEKVALKHTIIAIFFALNLLYFVLKGAQYFRSTSPK